MKNNLHLSKKFKADLKEIKKYISSALKSPLTAKNTINDILDTISNLETFSDIGSPLNTIIDVDTNYRYILSGNYMIFYHTENSTVEIDRVLYGKRDYINVILNTNQELNKSEKLTEKSSELFNSQPDKNTSEEFDDELEDDLEI